MAAARARAMPAMIRATTMSSSRRISAYAAFSTQRGCARTTLACTNPRTSSSSSRAAVASYHSSSTPPSSSSYASPTPSSSTSSTSSTSTTTPADEGDVFALPRNFITTTPTLPGYEIVGIVGLVSGNTVRVRNALLDYVAMVRAVFGGELRTYTDLMMEAREEATERMVNEAVALGANAIINVRATTSNLASNSSEIYVYGTAVVVRLENDSSSSSSAPSSSSTH